MTDKERKDLINRFRKLQDGHRVDGGYYRGVSACLRVLLEEMEAPRHLWTHDDDYWECGACHYRIMDNCFPMYEGGAPVYDYCPMCGAYLTGRIE